MTVEIWQLITGVVSIALAGGGLGGFLVNLRQSRHIEVQLTGDLLGYARDDVKSARTRLDEVVARLNDLESKYQRVLDDLENERHEAAERDHELDQLRAWRVDAEIRIAALEDRLRAVGINPEEIPPFPI